MRTLALACATLLGVGALGSTPLLAQHHGEPKTATQAAGHEPAPKRPLAARGRTDSASHAEKGDGSLGVVAPPLPTVAPGKEIRGKATQTTAHEPGQDTAHGAAEHEDAAPGKTPHGGAETDAAGGRRKVDAPRKTNSPADVAASINQRLAELAELRRTAPVAPRRPVPKRELPAAAATGADAPSAAHAAAQSAKPAVKLQWRVPVDWPEAISGYAHASAVTSSVAAAVAAAVP